jgi:hypothetical protein
LEKIADSRRIAYPEIRDHWMPPLGRDPGFIDADDLYANVGTVGCNGRGEVLRDELDRQTIG